ncbi:hypothetical protein [Parasitella parasitica]|uniref:Cyclin n=1 Tax=Parasitella parasitica TaxID=35722 RepID=A0A0B7NR57_9FUNG|nr:hypothetical protein [Parasitella parasitica]
MPPKPSTAVEFSTTTLDIANFPVDSLVDIVADLLDSIIETNDRLISNNATVTHFHSRTIPNIAVRPYLVRILKFTPFSNEVLLCLLIYFDRMVKFKKTRYAVNSYTVHRLLITGIVVASKFTSDVFYPNSRYAKVGGIPLCELNQLELEFLFLCNFDLHVKLEDMQAYGDQLLQHALINQQPMLSPVAEVTSLSVSSPPLSPPNTDSPYLSPTIPPATLKRKRELSDCSDQMKRPESLLDRATVSPALYQKLQNDSIDCYHLDTFLSNLYPP